MQLKINSKYNIKEAQGNFKYALASYVGQDLIFETSYNEYSSCPSKDVLHIMLIDGELKDINYDIIFKNSLSTELNNTIKLIKFNKPVNNIYTLSGSIYTELIYPTYLIKVEKQFFKDFMTYCDIFINAQNVPDTVKLNNKEISNITKKGMYGFFKLSLDDINNLETKNDFFIVCYPNKVVCQNTKSTQIQNKCIETTANWIQNYLGSINNENQNKCIETTANWIQNYLGSINNENQNK